MFDEVATSPFAAISVEGAQEEAWKAGVLVEVVMTGGDRSYEAAVLRKWAADRVDGVIYASILTRRVEPPDALSRHRAVLMNCYDGDGRFRLSSPPSAGAVRPRHRPCSMPDTAGSPSSRASPGWMPRISGWKATSARFAAPA
jgi:DNA-binding LacI/PurR family transcriptional regulator